MTATNVICPLCGAGAIAPVVRAGRWAIWSCRNCTNAWTDPPPGAIDYTSENFHASVLSESGNLAPHSLADLPPQWRYSLLQQVACLARVLGRGGRVLELGCGEGLLLEELARRGLQVVGVEPSVTASAIARQKGLEVHVGYFPGAPVTGPYNAVVMSHVLEHLPRPADVLAAVDSVLDGGYVLLVQTNWRGLMPRLRRQGWYAWVPDQHYWHFTPRGLEHLFKPLGWRTCSVEYSSLVHSPLLRFPSDLASRLPGLGDQFQILAQTRSRC